LAASDGKSGQIKPELGRQDMHHGPVGLARFGDGLDGDGHARTPRIEPRDALNLCTGLNLNVHEDRTVQRLGKRRTNGHNEHSPRGVQVASPGWF